VGGAGRQRFWFSQAPQREKFGSVGRRANTRTSASGVRHLISWETKPQHVIFKPGSVRKTEWEADEVQVSGNVHGDNF